MTKWIFSKVSVLQNIILRFYWITHTKKVKHYFFSFQRMMIHFLSQHWRRRTATTAALSSLAPWSHPTSPVTNRPPGEGASYLQQEGSGPPPRVSSEQVLSALLPRWDSQSWLCLILTQWEVNKCILSWWSALSKDSNRTNALVSVRFQKSKLSLGFVSTLEWIKMTL